jgi:GT2 family glycosyltransferase
MESRGFFLDTLYFLYWEDADLCMFARQRGMKCMFDAQATGRHAVAASSGGLYNPRGLYYQSRNVIFFTCRWSSRVQLLLYLPVVLLNRLGAVVKHVAGRRRSQARAVAIGVWHAFRHVRWKSSEI